MSDTTSRPVRSMTGQGHAAGEGELGTVGVEVRTVNNRGFKCTPRLSESLACLDSRIEALARSLIHRGTVHLSVIWHRPVGQNLPNIDAGLLQAYYKQLQQFQQWTGESGNFIELSNLMTLPGVITSSREDRRDDEPLWEFVSQIIIQAIDNLNQMREVEGAHMAESLLADCDQIEQWVGKIAELAPRAAESYRARLESKIRRILAEHEIESQPLDLLREVQIFADRTDVSEEITRLGSHLKMFAGVLQGEGNGAGKREPTGRKLDFVIQEMFRETNTIGSKAADAEISALVVEIKCAIERMRELVQNLE
ncbi:MAG: YicC family protein [Pirellulales bacterium]|nr:YicC family protein [Pirellulales bacterium]